MLLVIFGAGASFDSVPHYLPGNSPFPIDKYRPPLANQLFDDRDAFVAIMQRFSDCLPLIPHLRGGVQVEQRLARFQSEAAKYPARHRQLAAIRYYLHVMLWTCQINWSGQHHGITNYATLLDTIERWRFESGEQVCFVTFNYDTMLEEAMKQVLHFQLDVLPSYVNQTDYKLVKLHGSVNWGRFIQDGFPTPPIDNQQQIIKVAADLKISDSYTLVDGYPMLFQKEALVFPALAIPIEKKDCFECPQEHIEVLASIIPRVTKVVTVGWRATEEHFLNMLRKPLTGLATKNIDLLIVSGSQDGAQETLKNLSIGVATDRYGSVPTGFSGLTRNLETLDVMLRETPWQKGR